MKIIFVVSHLHDWPVPVPGAQVVTARAYLTDTQYSESADCRVFNLCRSCDYQSRGYYVSMVAEARGHHPLPDVKAIEDLHSGTLACRLAERFDPLFQSSLSHVEQDAFELDLWFGRSADPRFEQLGEQLFNLLRAPLLRAEFARKSEGKRADDRRWRLRSVRALHPGDIDPRQRRAVAQAAADCLKGHRQRWREPAAKKPMLAILRSPDCPALPSNPAAIRKFQEAAESLGMRSEVITHAQADRIPEFDALFIRETTNVNHYTYQMARQAALAGMVVIDDPDSILKCGNKVYMAELLGRHGLPIPKTLMVHPDNLDQVIPTLGLPCILKQPDGAFSLGVEKVESEQELREKAQQLFASSELLQAQEYLPTDFDWRIGILDRKPLFACKYFMAPGHWQIIKHEDGSGYREGISEAVAIGAAPRAVIDIALRAAGLIGDGFYGVDLKQRGQQCWIIEINDNPNVDAGNEDGVLKDALYLQVMDVFRKRIEARKGRIA
jgi:glutathione synthase/RimK-type ligase-like ATP-grasp enzyme